ncbi:MAG: YigZ family protein [Gemmatimonadetes bacterium]|nr:YigZ family protein [Gemmatimonadota bacterium]
MTAPGYPVPARIHRVEDVVQRSRFLTTLAHAPTSDAAHAFVARVRDELPDATHHCWAFVAGPPGSTAHMGMSDAGEPHGTAGRPMLTALLHGGVGEVVAVSSRWFGGTKLGTGGLARAYAGGVTHALESLPTEWRVERRRRDVVVGYAHVDGLRQLMDELDVTLIEEVYGAEVRYVVGVPESAEASFRRRLADLTSGEARVGER